MTAVRVAIIGGGITGLTAAFSLWQRARDSGVELICDVYERDTRFGGKIITHREGGFTLEGGPESFLARKPQAIELVRSLGIESELVNTGPNAHQTYIVRNGALMSMPPGTSMGIPVRMGPFLRSSLLSPMGKARVLADLILPSTMPPGDESLGAFFRRRLGDEWLEQIGGPLLAGIYAGRPDDLSLLATFPQFRRMQEAHRSLILGARAQTQPATATPPGPSTRSVFATVRGGLMTIIERLYDVLHEWAQLHAGTSITALQPTSSGAYRLVVNTAGVQHDVEADAIILAIPPFNAAELLAPLDTEIAHALSSIPYTSTATITIAYPADRIPQTLHGSGFLVPAREQRTITACTWLTDKWPHTTPDGYVVIRCFVGRSGDTQWQSWTDDDMVTRVRKDIRDLMGIDTTPLFTRVTRWYDAMPQYVPGHLQTIERIERALQQQLPGVFVAGGGFRGIGIPDCIGQGQGAADQAWNFVRQPDHTA